MTRLAEIQDAIRRLAPEEQQALRHWLDESAEETPEMLTAIDQGLQSLHKKGSQATTRAELQAKVRRWAGASR